MSVTHILFQQIMTVNQLFKPCTFSAMNEGIKEQLCKHCIHWQTPEVTNIPAQKWHCFPIVLCVLHPTLPYLHTPNNIDNCLTHSSINVNIKWRKNYTQKYHDLRWVRDPEMGWHIQRWVRDPKLFMSCYLTYTTYFLLEIMRAIISRQIENHCSSCWLIDFSKRFKVCQTFILNHLLVLWTRGHHSHLQHMEQQTAQHELQWYAPC